MKRRRSAGFFQHEQLDWFGERSLERAMRAGCRRLCDEARVGARPLDHRRGILRGGRWRLADRRGDGDEEGDCDGLHDRRDVLASAKGGRLTEYVGRHRHRQAGGLAIVTIMAIRDPAQPLAAMLWYDSHSFDAASAGGRSQIPTVDPPVTIALRTREKLWGSRSTTI